MTEHLKIPSIDPAVLRAFLTLFFPRQDIHARQRLKGKGYSHRKEPVTLELLTSHLAGDLTLGTYCLTAENTAHFVVIDTDEEALWHQALLKVKSLDMPVYIEQSRRGGHLWHFFKQPLLGQMARTFGRALLGLYELPLTTEIYPRQSVLADGPGSLIRLPFGFHRKVHLAGQPGKRFGFQTVDGAPLAPTIREQLTLLAFAERVQQAVVERLCASVPTEPLPLPPTKPFRVQPTNPELPLSERIKASISVFDFVSRYVELDERGTGLCPFHDDEHQSFGVNRNGNYWSCFAGCSSVIDGKTIRGGSVIHFWQRWREKEGQDGSLKATMGDLANLLGL